MMSRFEICLPYVLVQEGRPGTKVSDWVNADGSLNVDCWRDPHNFSNDAHDPGGKTFNGIEQREYTLFLKRWLYASRDVRLMTPSEGYAIYHSQYWDPHCDAMPTGFDLVFFDASVNEGDHESIMILQHVLAVTTDGDWGQQTQDAWLTKHRDNARLIDDFTNRRKEVYREMRGFQYFGTDWLRRADEQRSAAWKMIGAIS